MENGDKIVSVDNKKIEKFNDIRLEIIINQPSSIQVDRNGEMIDLPIPSTFTAQVLKTENVGFIQEALIAEVHEVMDGSPAEEAGLQFGDRIVKLNNDTTPFFQDVVKTYPKVDPELLIKVMMFQVNLKNYVGY